MLFETQMFMGQPDKDLKEIIIKAGSPRESNNKLEAIFGPYCCDLTLSLDNENETRTISAPSQFTCITNTLCHCREWIRGIAEEQKNKQFHLKIDGQLRELSIDQIFATTDCLTTEMQDKIEFAEAKGYTEEWESIAVIKPTVNHEIAMQLTSDFGQIQIFDNLFEGQELSGWDTEAHKAFACITKEAAFLRVMENDDHRIKFELCETEPSESLEPFIHVVDVPFETSGFFDLADQPLRVASGKYAIRWYIKQREETWEYKIKMWPKKIKKPLIRKQYEAQHCN